MLLPLAKILNVDETGHKENGQRMYTWCFRAREYVLFKIAESRGTAVLLDAFLVRLVLVPAVLHIVGPKAWWLPRFVDRVLPDIRFAH